MKIALAFREMMPTMLMSRTFDGSVASRTCTVTGWNVLSDSFTPLNSNPPPPNPPPPRAKSSMTPAFGSLASLDQTAASEPRPTARAWNLIALPLRNDGVGPTMV